MAAISSKLLQLAKKRLYYKQNPIAFIEECIKIPSAGGSELVKLYEPQKKIIRSFFKDHNLILLKTRQVGMSTLCQIMITYIFTFYDNCVVGIISRDSAESTDFCRKVQMMIDGLPAWIRPEYRNKVVQYFVLKNGCQLHTSAVSSANPGAVFRSKTITFLVIDEAAHIRYIDEAWTGIASTLSKAHKVAERNNIPFGTIILSTPNRTQGIGKWFFDLWRKSNINETNFKPHTTHWKEIPDFADDPAWYEKQCKMLGTPAKIAQELEMKFIDSENALFDEEVQIQLQECVNTGTSKRVYVPNMLKHEGELWKFREPNRGHFHLIGIDCAGQTGKDKFAIEVIEYETMNQVYEFHGKLDPKRFVNVVRFVCALVPYNCLIIDASGGYGQTVCYDLLYDDLEYNIYGENKKSGAKTVFEPGLKITKTNRPLIIDAMFDYVSNDPSIILSSRLSMELLTLVEIKNDKVEAEADSNDDLALAYAYCCYMRKYKSMELGETESREDMDLMNDLNKDTYELLRGINNPDAPFAGEYQTAMVESIEGDDISDYQRKTDELYDKLNESIYAKVLDSSMTGNIDVLELMGIDTSVYGRRV